MLKYILGPELIWVFIYGVSHFVSIANKSLDHPMDNFIETCWFWVPVLSVLTFVLYWVPIVDKSWLMLRIWVVCFIGGHFVLEKLMSAYSNQGPGIGMGYLAGMIMIFIFVISCSVIVKLIH